MSQNPQERSKDSKKVAEDNIDQQIDNEDPTETAEVTEEDGGKASDIAEGTTSGLWIFYSILWCCPTVSINESRGYMFWNVT